LGFIPKVVIPFLLIAFIMFSQISQSDELNQNQKEFSSSIESYNKLRAEIIVEQAKNEAHVQQKTKDIEVAQRLSDDKTETQDERIEQLEKKLQSVTQELQELKSEGMPDDRLKSIEDKLSILAEEIDNIKSASVVADPTYEQVYGAAPAASKVYLKDKGLSIGGYGELLVGQVREDENNIVDAQRVVLYFGYKFTDRIIFNSEIEFEHATTESNVDGDSGSVSVEFALLDFLLWPELNLRGGLLLAPFGIINEVHEPTTFFGVFRPSVERQIIPTTWRENGLGIFGDIDLGAAGSINYRSYAMNSFDARGFRAANNRSLRNRGGEARFNDIAWVSRVEYEPVPYVAIGASMFLGNTGQNETIDNAESPFNGDKLKGFFQMYEADIQLQYSGFEARGLFVYTTLDDGARINALNDLEGDNSVGSEQCGYYVVGAYNVLSLANFSSQYAQYLAPFIRWEQYDTQAKVPSGFTRNPANDRNDLTIGLNYKPIPNVVMKAEYQRLDNEANSSENQFNFGLGYVF
jgi:DNA-binding transcriptional MerR regulator